MHGLKDVIHRAALMGSAYLGRLGTVVLISQEYPVERKYLTSIFVFFRYQFFFHLCFSYFDACCQACSASKTGSSGQLFEIFFCIRASKNLNYGGDTKTNTLNALTETFLPQRPFADLNICQPYKACDVIFTQEQTHHGSASVVFSKSGNVLRVGIGCRLLMLDCFQRTHCYTHVSVDTWSLRYPTRVTQKQQQTGVFFFFGSVESNFRERADKVTAR